VNSSAHCVDENNEQRHDEKNGEKKNGVVFHETEKVTCFVDSDQLNISLMRNTQPITPPAMNKYGTVSSSLLLL